MNNTTIQGEGHGFCGHYTEVFVINRITIGRGEEFWPITKLAPIFENIYVKTERLQKYIKIALTRSLNLSLILFYFLTIQQFNINWILILSFLRLKLIYRIGSWPRKSLIVFYLGLDQKPMWNVSEYIKLWWIVACH